MIAYRVCGRYKDEDMEVYRVVKDEDWARELVFIYRDSNHLTQGGGDLDSKFWYEKIDLPEEGGWEL